MILGSRDPERGQVALKEIVESIGGNCQERLEFLLLDTSSDDSVRLAAQTFHNKYGDQSLYGIINNAGVRRLYCFDMLLKLPWIYCLLTLR